MAKKENNNYQSEENSRRFDKKIHNYIRNENDLDSYSREKLEEIKERGKLLINEIEFELQKMEQHVRDFKMLEPDSTFNILLEELRSKKEQIVEKIQNTESVINKIKANFEIEEANTEQKPIEEQQEKPQEEREPEVNIKDWHSKLKNVNFGTVDEMYLRGYITQAENFLNYIDGLDETERQNYKNEYETIGVLIENAKKLLNKRQEILDKESEQEHKSIEPETDQKEIQKSEDNKEEKSSKSKSLKEKKIEVFEHLSNFNLSDSQKYLIIEDFLQYKFDIIQEDVQKEFREDFSKKKFFGKIWAGIKKEYSLAKNEQSKVKNFLNKKLSDADIEILNLLIDRTNNSDFDLETLKNGKVNVLYSGKWDNYEPTEENKTLINEFNKVANEFKDVSYEWSLDTAKKSQRKDYEEKETQFNNLYAKLYKLAEEKGNKDFLSNDFNAKLNQNIKLNQFIVQNQDIEKQIQKSSKQIAWIKAFKNEFISKGAWAFAGAATRFLTMSGIGFVGGLLGAGAIGALRSRETGKKELVQTDKNARRDIRGKHMKNVVDLERTTKHIIYKRDENGEILFDENKNPIIDKEFENTTGLINKLERLLEKIENTKDYDKRRDLLNSLDLRISYTEDKINAGLVNFGDKEQRLSNQFRILELINRAKLLKDYFGGCFDKKQDLSNEDIQKMELQISEVNRLREELDQLRKNNKENPNVEELPEIIEKHEKISEILNNPDLRHYILNDKLEKLLFSTEGHIKDERRKFLLNKATQGAIISVGAFVAGYGARALLEHAGILAHNIDGPEDVAKLIKNGHLTDKDIDTIFNNPKLFKNENIINEVINNKRDLTGHINKLLDTYPDARGNTSILRNLETLTTSKSDKAFLGKLIEENTQGPSLGNQSMAPSASAIEGVVAGSTPTGESIIENIDINNMNADQIHELASQGATVTRGGSVSEALNLGMAPGSKMTLITFDENGSPVIHDIDANVILEGAKIIKKGQQIFAIDEKNSYESFYKYYADNPDEILRVIKPKTREVSEYVDGLGIDKSISLNSEDLQSQFEDLKLEELHLEGELRTSTDRSDMIAIAKKLEELDVKIKENLKKQEEILLYEMDSPINTKDISMPFPDSKNVATMENLKEVMGDVKDNVSTRVNIHGQELGVQKVGRDFYADIDTTQQGLEKITPDYFDNLGKTPIDQKITLNSGEIVDNPQSRPLTTENIHYPDLIKGDKIKEFIEFKRGSKDLEYDLWSIYENKYLKTEDKLKILNNIKKELQNYQDLESTRLRTEEKWKLIYDCNEAARNIDHKISLLNHEDGTSIRVSDSGGGVAEQPDTVFAALEDQSNFQETFYDPSISASRKIELITNFVNDAKVNGKVSIDGMDFIKQGNNIYYKSGPDLIKLTETNLERIMNWRHQAFSKIDLSKLDNVQISDVAKISDVENAQKALQTFLSNDSYSNKIKALQDVIRNGEQISVGSATFARKGNDIYYILSNGNGVELTPDNMEKINTMLSNARQAVLKKIADDQ
ncbi:MAG: hypothetical protein PHH83_02635 [Patescibacteria group bacterium]|nr:hypothetical protein [Patescibacteria group bacterium]